MKIAILVNEATMDVCTGKGCFNAFNKRIDSFKSYGNEVELVAFTHVGGDLEHKIDKLINNGVEVVHLSTCVRAKYEDYDNLVCRLAQYFTVVGYTHGSENGRNKNIICLHQIKGSMG